MPFTVVNENDGSFCSATLCTFFLHLSRSNIQISCSIFPFHGSRTRITLSRVFLNDSIFWLPKFVLTTVYTRLYKYNTDGDKYITNNPLTGSMYISKTMILEGYI